MTKNKTIFTDVNVNDFLDSFVDNEQKKQDSIQLISLLEKWSGYKAQMYGPSIIGFGSYHYVYESGHEGDAPILAFSPRKNALTLYVYSKTDVSEKLLEKLGKFKATKGCLYVKKLADIDLNILEQICKITIDYINENHECACREN